jgi:hypothetical protein
LCLRSFVFGLALWVVEDVTLKESIVGIGSLVKEAWALGVELERRLELLEGIVDLDFLGGVDFLGDNVLGIEIDGGESGLVNVLVFDESRLGLQY